MTDGIRKVDELDAMLAISRADIIQAAWAAGKISDDEAGHLMAMNTDREIVDEARAQAEEGSFPLGSFTGNIGQLLLKDYGPKTS